jgi:hypothetical protein
MEEEDREILINARDLEIASLEIDNYIDDHPEGSIDDLEGLGIDIEVFKLVDSMEQYLRHTVNDSGVSMLALTFLAYGAHAASVRDERITEGNL